MSGVEWSGVSKMSKDKEGGNGEGRKRGEGRGGEGR